MSCFFYLHRPEAGSAAELIAECECDWSTLESAWRVMLAGAEICPSLVSPRRSEDVPAPQGLRVPASQAIRRFERLCAVIQDSPLMAQMPLLPIYLAGALAFLRERAAAHAPGHPGELFLVGQYEGDEDEELEGFAHDLPLRQQLHAEAWEAIERIGTERAYHELDEELGFAMFHKTFTEWEAWVRHFGLGSFEHPYFKRLSYHPYRNRHEGPPDDTPFDAFDPELEAQGQREAAVLQRWRETDFHPAQGPDGRWGLRHDEDAGSEAASAWALDPEWDALFRDPNCTEAAWVRRAGQWGLLRLGRPCRLLVPPSLDAVRDPVLDGCGDASADATVVVQGGRHGVMCSSDGRWLARPEYDEVWPVQGTMLRMRRQERHGFLNEQGEAVVPAEYDEAHDFDSWTRHYPSSLAWVARGGLWGVVDKTGAVIQPCQFERFERPGDDDGALGWRVVRGGRTGWLNADGSWGAHCEWDSVQPCRKTGAGLLGLFEVTLQGRHGLVASGGAVWLPCEYLAVTPLGLGPEVPHEDEHEFDGILHRDAWPDDEVPAFVAALDGSRPLVLIAVETESGTGVVDQANRCLVPPVYRQVVPCADGLYDYDARWLRLTAHDGRQGMWSMAGQAELLACVFHDVALISSVPGQRPVIVTVRRLDPRSEDLHNFRCELKHPDGTPAFEGEYLWINADGFGYQMSGSSVHGHNASECHGIAQLWAEGRAIRALRYNVDGPPRLVWLRPGRPPMGDDAKLRLDHQRGDPTAALLLARDHLEGFHRPKDEAQARQWAERACAQPGRPASATQPCGQAMLLYARLLADGVGGPADLPLARQWAQRALETDEGSSDEACALAGRLLLDENAGPIDPERAIDLLERVGDRGRAAGEANYWLGRCYRDGIGVEPDAQAAREKWERAEADHHQAAVPALADLLRTMAEGESDPEAAALLREQAALYGRKWLQSLSGPGDPDYACAHARLGTLLLQLRSVDWAAARKHLERAAEGGRLDAMRLLAKRIHASAASPLRDPALARQWRRRYIEERTAGRPWLLRLVCAAWLRVAS